MLNFHFLDCACQKLQITKVGEDASAAQSNVVGVFEQLENSNQGGYPQYKYNRRTLFYKKQAQRWTTSKNSSSVTQQLRSEEGKDCPDQIGSFWQFGNEERGLLH